LEGGKGGSGDERMAKVTFQRTMTKKGRQFFWGKSRVTHCQLPHRLTPALVRPLFIRVWKVFRIGTVRYNWPMSAHAPQAFSIAHCSDSEDLPPVLQRRCSQLGKRKYFWTGIIGTAGCKNYRFGVIAAYYSNLTLCIFERPSGGLRDNVRCSSRAHCKAHSGLPVSVN